MVLNLMTEPYIYRVPRLKNLILDNHRNKKSDVLAISESFMDKFNNKISVIPINEYEGIFIYAFRSHLFAKVYKQSDFDYSGHDFLVNTPLISTNCQLKIEKIIDELLMDNNYNSLLLEKKYLVQIYYMILSYNKKGLIFDEKNFIHVETDLSEIHEKSLEKCIYDHLKYEFNETFLGEGDFQKADITITNVDISDSKRNQLLVSYPIRMRDISIVKKVLNEFKNNK